VDEEAAAVVLLARGAKSSNDKPRDLPFSDISLQQLILSFVLRNVLPEAAGLLVRRRGY